MNAYHKKYSCRSDRMRLDEIEQERSTSGWNPYEGEEEAHFSNDSWMVQPCFSGMSQDQRMEEQQNEERDLRALQSMFPDGARILLPYIEEECDKMEYEGSPMYDGYPDRETVYRIQDNIYHAVKDQYPEQPQEAPDDMLTMQYQGRRRNPPGKNWLEDMIRVLLLQEIHHRRCRHGRCRRNYGRA